MDKRVTEAVDFALTTGLIKYNTEFKLTHAPFCLSPFPLKDKLNDYLVNSTPVFNELMVKVGADKDFIKHYLEPVAATDDFISRLLTIYSETELSHHLQLSRNDFLIAADGETGELHPKQVEFNTISNSFLFLTQRMYKLHQHMSYFVPCGGTLAENNTLDEAVAAIAEVVQYYDKSNACILMVVQDREQNLFDQRGLEYSLWEKFGIPTVRLSLEQVAEQGVLKEGHLVVEDKTAALVYFRAGYTPNDYQSQAAWEGRILIENSSAVKCPSVGMQLAGAKKIQQILAKPGILERYLTADLANSLKSTFVGMYDLNELIGNQKARELAKAEPHKYVLKPQREGGGNNLYDGEMVTEINKMSEEKQKAYVLMERIFTPRESSVLVVDRMAEETQTVSEVGRYGACFHDGQAIRFNKDIGYLVRTKSSNQNEGGVCAGYACLNSLCVG